MPCPPQISLSSISSPNVDERQWVINIRKSIEEDSYSHSDTPVSIFVVPKTLMVVQPNCYTPQHVALGPNHYFCQHLHDMEGYKIAAAKRIQKQHQNFGEIVNNFIELESEIRACYQRFIKCDGETLAWIMAVDAAFLLEFLQIFSMEDEMVPIKDLCPKDPSTDSQDAHYDATGSINVTREIFEEEIVDRLMFSHVHDYAGTKHALDVITRDIMMLENQIPLFVLRDTLKAQCSSEESTNDLLYSMLKGFCRAICPFTFIDDLPKNHVTKRAHLLDYMYHMILPQAQELMEHDGSVGTDIGSKKDKKKSLRVTSQKIPLLSKIEHKAPWKSLSKQGNEDSILDDDDYSEEIAIPSVTDLTKAGARFEAIQESKFDIISFDIKKGRLSLPIVSLDANTEVVLRNLVAYEASFITSGALYFTRYTELMNGIIDTAEDVKILRKNKIIFNYLKSDKEASNLWNGMSRSVRPTNVPDLDQVIKDANTYYDRRWVIRCQRCLSFYVYGSWQFLTLVAAILVVVFEMCQAVCSIYDCNSIYQSKNSGH